MKFTAIPTEKFKTNKYINTIDSLSDKTRPIVFYVKRGASLVKRLALMEVERLSRMGVEAVIVFKEVIK